MISESLALRTLAPYSQVLHAHLWTPEPSVPVQSVILCLHGVTCHSGHFEPLAEMLTPKGIAVAGLELRGHGVNSRHPQCVSFSPETCHEWNGYGWKKQLLEIDQFFDLCSSAFPRRGSSCWASPWAPS